MTSVALSMTSAALLAAPLARPLRMRTIVRMQGVLVRIGEARSDRPREPS